jgi:hypothetical protein
VRMNLKKSANQSAKSAGKRIKRRLKNAFFIDFRYYYF